MQDQICNFGMPLRFVPVMSFIAKESPESQVAFCCYISLATLNLKCFLSAFIVSHELDIFEGSGLLFCRMSLELGVSDVYS